MIINEKIYLTPFRSTDKAHLISYLNDSQVAANTLMIPSPYTEHDADEWLTLSAALETRKDKTKNWAIRLRATDELIGGIGIIPNSSFHAQRCEIGYWLGKPFRRQGIMSEVVRVFSDDLLNNQKFVRVEAAVFTNNPASASVLTKAGFDREGYLRKVYKKGENYLDALLFAKV